MSLLRTLFRSRKQEADAPARPRLLWPRVRRSLSAADVLDAHLQRTSGDAAWPRSDETGAPGSGRSTVTLLPPPSPPSSSSGHEDPINIEPARESKVIRLSDAESSVRHTSADSSHYHLHSSSGFEREAISSLSLSSETGGTSRLNRLDPARAKEAFNAMAGRFHLPLRIPAEEPTIAESKDRPHPISDCWRPEF
ncbi:hypothetical protein F1880_002520 [Penicillium rolfsii]|nr:hypothetical protein F1880_002520 [Penicillium rolfsii]